ncbi:MAG: hypothetical protein IPG22_13145 [Acidobacteria bacterium]|nr:hypothetical protein [Acidobacteriota bacterium]
MSRIYIVIIILLFATAGVIGQITPRDANEAEALQIYQQYKASRAAEAAASSAIKQVRNDIASSSMSTIGVFGSDPADRARLTQLRQTVDAERRRQAELLDKWGSKFYWRYGDLTWSEEKIRDAKTKREMDRIEFALTYFPFDPKRSETAQPVVTSGADSTSLTLEVPGFWGHLSYTITGARLDTPTGSDRGFIGGRQYKGVITGRTLTVSGKGISDNVSPGGPGSGYFYELVASVSSGKESKEYRYGAQVGEKLNRSFSLSIPVVPGQSGSFSIGLYYRNTQYGDRGWLVTGSLNPGTAGSSVQGAAISNPPKAPPQAPTVSLAGEWRSTWGKTTFTQNGNTVTGTYEHDNGKFTGTVKGNTVIGSWSEAPTYQSPKDAGDIELTLSPDGKKFVGRWRYGSTGPWRTDTWNGAKPN